MYYPEIRIIISLFPIDPEQNQDQDDDDIDDENTSSDSNNNIYFDTSKKDIIPEILDISTRDLEEPIELTGIEDLPIQRTKFYLPPLISDSDSVELYQRPAIDYGTMNIHILIMEKTHDDIDIYLL